MSKQIVEVNSYQPKPAEKFFFDANIWMLIYCPLGGYESHIIAEYSNFLKKIKKEKASLFISSLVLSEFFNAYVRLEFKLWKNNDCKNQEYKEFKRTQSYNEIASEARYTIENSILRAAKRVDDRFSEMNIDELFLQIENSDFNDNYYLQFVLMEQMIFVTNDGNMSSQNIKSSIITGNPNLLKQGVS